MKFLTRYPLVVVTWLLLSLTLIAAEKQWTGAAQNVPQITTIAVSGTWATGNQASVTCNNKAVIVTVGADILASDIADIFARAINSVNATNNIKTDETRNVGGYEYGEFRDMVATNSGDDLVLTSAKLADVSYSPFTVSVAVISGTGVLTLPGSNTQDATGKHHLDNPDNWSGGTLYAAGDTLVFGDVSTDVRWGLANAVERLSLVRTNSFTSNLGLESTNLNTPAMPYTEYRAQYVVLPNTAITGDQVVVLGDAGSSVTAIGKTKIDFGTVAGNSLNVTINDSPAFSSTTGAAVTIVGGNTAQTVMNGGSTRLGGAVDDTATRASVHRLSGNAYVHITDQCETLGVIPTQTIYSGTLIDEGKGSSGGLTQYGGSVFSRRTAGTPGTVTLYGGVFEAGEDVTTLKVHGGATFGVKAGESITVTNATAYTGYTINDLNNQVTWTNGIDFVGGKPSDGELNVQDSQTWTPSGL